MVDFVFNIHSELGTQEIFEPENLIQKCKTVIPESQLPKGIQSKSIRAWEWSPRMEAKPPTKSEGLGGRSPHIPNLIFFLHIL